jgi:hypothetical protein
VLKPGGSYQGLREGLAASSLKPLYRRFSHGITEEEHYDALENVYNYAEWKNLFHNFRATFQLKHSYKLGVARRERVYYFAAGIIPEKILRHLMATIVIRAEKPAPS